MVRVGDLNAEDPGSNPGLGLRNGFVLGDPRDKFTTHCKQPTGLPPTSWDFLLGLERGGFERDTEKPL